MSENCVSQLGGRTIKEFAEKRKSGKVEFRMAARHVSCISNKKASAMF